MSEKANVNFLTADGLKFAHPLHHLGKSKQDLPLIAIDSFRHMYLFPNYKEMNIPGKVKTFLQDLYSGKLHREFHYGPDPVTEEKKEESKEEDKQENEDNKPDDSSNNDEEGEVKEENEEAKKHIPRTEEDTTTEKPKTKKTDPPESQFVHLGPSKNRYTILRDEF